MACRASSLAMVLVCSVVFGSANAAPAGYAPAATVQQITYTETGGPNVMLNFPRLTSTGATGSADLGSFDILDCSRPPGGRTTCSAPSVSPSSVSTPGSIGQYLIGLLAYSIVNIIIVLCIILYTLILLCARYIAPCVCGTCCFKDAGCIAMRCGAPWPTRRRYCCGFVQVSNTAFVYPLPERILAYSMMVVTIVCVFCFMIVGELKGNTALNSKLQMLTTATDGVAAMVQQAVAPTLALLDTFSADIVGGTLVALNSTVQSSVDLQAVMNGVTCITAAVPTLPNVTFMLAFVAQLNTSLARINGSITSTLRDVNVLSMQQSTLAASATGLSATLGGVNASLAGITPALNNADAALTGLNNLYTATLTPGNGTVYVLQSQLMAAQRVSNGGGIPNAADFSAAATGGSGSMQRLIAGQMTGSVSEVGTLVGRLATIHDALAATPNFNATAQLLENVTAVVNATLTTNPLIGRMRVALAGVEAALRAVPTGASIAPTVRAMNATAYAISLNGLIADITALSSAIQSLPSLTALSAQLAAVRQVPLLFPCINSVAAQLARFNASLIALPSSLSFVSTLVATINASVSSAIAQGDKYEVMALNASAFVSGVNTSAYMAQAQSAAATVAQQRAALNVSSILASLVNMDVSLAANFSSLNVSLNTFEANLRAVNIPSNASEGLRGLQLGKQLLLTQLQRVIAMGSASMVAGDYRLLRAGFCSSSGALCNLTSQCASGTCIAQATSRCYSPTVATAQSVSCALDTQCTGAAADAYCLGDATRAITLNATLTAFAQSSTTPDLSGPLAQFMSLTSASSIDTSSAQSTLTSARSALTAVDVATYQASLTSLSTSLSAFDISSTTAVLNSAAATIAQVDVASVAATLASVQGPVNDITGTYLSTLTSASNAINVTISLFNTQLPLYLRRLSKANMVILRMNAGAGRAAVEVTRVLDDMVTFIRTQQSIFNLSAVNAYSSVQSYAESLDRFTSSGSFAGSSSLGSLHYLATLAGMSNLLTPASAAAMSISLGRVYNDANDKVYPGGKICVTSACLAATVDAVNAAPVSDIAAILGMGTRSGATSLTRRGALQVLWIAPALLCALGLLSLFARLCCNNSPRWQKAAPAVMAGGIICASPCMFILLALVWPLVMLMGDVCATGVNVGVNALVSYGDDACASIGGNGTLNSCRFSATLPIGNATAALSLPILPIYRDVFGACEGTSPGTNPIASVLDQIATQMQSIPVSVASSVVSSASSGSFAVQPPLAAVFTSAASVAGRGLAAYVNALSASALSCPSINSAVFVTKDSVCTGVVSPLFWLVAAWYMIAWVLFCCGLPAAIIGRKRFTTDLWGPVYDAVLDDVQDGSAPLQALRADAHAGAGPPGLVIRNVKPAPRPVYSDDAVDNMNFELAPLPPMSSVSSEDAEHEQEAALQVVVVPQSLRQPQ